MSNRWNMRKNDQRIPTFCLKQEQTIFQLFLPFPWTGEFEDVVSTDGYHDNFSMEEIQKRKKAKLATAQGASSSTSDAAATDSKDADASTADEK